MHTTNHRKQHDLGRYLPLGGWYKRRHDARLDARIKTILDERRTTKTHYLPEERLTLPSIWGHKKEVLTGDTIYLGHNNTVHSCILSALDGTELEEGQVSVTSPIGKALIGRHTGDKICLTTLDGRHDYTILKII